MAESPHRGEASVKPWAYYNENDPYAVEWLRALIRSGAIPDGVVDDRSIADVDPADLFFNLDA